LIVSFIFYLIQYNFDSVDGYHARRKNMITEFGDHYDHITDLIVTGILLYMIYKRYKKINFFIKNKYIIIIFITLFFFNLSC